MSQPPDVSVTPVNTGAAVSQQVRDIAASKIHDAISGFALTNALFTLIESKLFADLQAGPVSAETAAAAHKYDYGHTVGLLRFLVTQDILKEDPGERFRLTPVGESTLAQGPRGWVHMYRGGYGDLMMRSGQLLDGSLVCGRDVHRDGHFVAYGSNEATSAVLTEVPFAVIEKLGAKTLVDLGCGAASLLIDWVKRAPQNRGIGVDVDKAAIETGRKIVAEAGLSDRINLVLGNGFDLSAIQKECAEGDIFTSFAMEHEVLRDGEESVLTHIDKMAELFPRAIGYLLGEPMLNMTREDGIFYWLHTLSRQGIPRNINGWVTLLRRLSRARFERVYVPDHGRYGAYFDIRFR